MIRAEWYNQDNNWGDKLNPYLIKRISGQDIVQRTELGKRFLCVGSIIHLADDDATVWGSGFVQSYHHCAGTPKVLAVRGPLTRDKLLADGIACPEVYGDPALLLPRYFKPETEKQYVVGIIPHYIDKYHPWLDQFRLMQSVKIIDIQGDVEQVPKDILSCSMIFSSSLHGIIAADAYGIDGYWIQFSDKLGDIKFADYLHSVHRPIDPLIISDTTSLIDLERHAYDYNIDIDLDALLNTCPFA